MALKSDFISFFVFDDVHSRAERERDDLTDALDSEVRKLFGGIRKPHPERERERFILNIYSSIRQMTSRDVYLAVC